MNDRRAAKMHILFGRSPEGDLVWEVAITDYISSGYFSNFEGHRMTLASQNYCQFGVYRLLKFVTTLIAMNNTCEPYRLGFQLGPGNHREKSHYSHYDQLMELKLKRQNFRTKVSKCFIFIKFYLAGYY